MSWTMNVSMRCARGLLLGAGLLCGAGVSQATGIDAARYVDLYGLVDPASHPEVRHAQRMFDRLRRFGGQVSPNARLLVIDSDSKPWAIALPDDSVVLSRGALDVIYRDGDRERADAELAFVLGHELAHLGTRDLWHQMVYASLAGSDEALGDAALASLESSLADASMDLAAWRDRELRADEMGFVIAALGGYAVERVLGDGEQASDFLSIWVRQTRAEGSRTHYAARERTAFLRQRLREASLQVQTFDMGVMLAHFGRHADALPFFETFQRRYPSAQALSNLGYVQLQLAREAMPAALAYRFWMPTLLETDSGLRVPTRGLREGLSEPARRLLERAIVSLQAAVRANERDVGARINLAVAQWYLGEVFHARATVEDALERRPADGQLQALRALILLEQDPQIDMGPRTITLLEALVVDEPAAVNVLYNLARVLDERRREGRASAVYERLSERLSEVPPVFAHRICDRVPAAAACTALARAGASASVAATGPGVNWFPVPPGTPVSRVLERSPSVAREVRRLDMNGIAVARIEIQDGFLLALNGVVEVAAMRPSSPLADDQLIEKLGEPQVVLAAGADRLQAFAGGVSARVRGGDVNELWLAR